MKKVIEYAVTVIPSRKILMGIPNYAYDWLIPFQQGTAAKTLTINSALQLAIERKTEIMFDKPSQTPYFNYTDERGSKHVVWFENARSIQSKLSLVNMFNLAGISYWTINNLHLESR